MNHRSPSSVLLAATSMLLASGISIAPMPPFRTLSRSEALREFETSPSDAARAAAAQAKRDRRAARNLRRAGLL